MTDNTTQKVGFIGLGAMGSAMSRNLLKAGFKVSGFDVSATAREALRSDGGVAATSPADAARGADLVITMLPNADVVRDVLKSSDGVLSVAGAARPLLNTSTIGPADALKLADECGASSWSYVDCAVGRTATQAAERKSLFLLGGPSDLKAAVRPALEAMGDTIIDCGDVGQASTLKVVNNYLALVGCLATAEALMLARAGSVDDAAALEVINGTSARNGNSMQNFPSKVLKGDVTPGFSLTLGRKDLALALSAIGDRDVPNFLGARALEAFDLALANGRGANDCSDILNMLATSTGDEP